jgi:hypothetical protein
MRRYKNYFAESGFERGIIARHALFWPVVKMLIRLRITVSLQLIYLRSNSVLNFLAM